MSLATTNHRAPVVFRLVLAFQLLLATSMAQSLVIDSEAINDDVFLFQDNNANVNPIENDDSEDDGYKNFNDWKDDLFLIFRFGLFFFIICFPCIRGVRVWFMAGGRILFRRTQSGWIIGLRYQAANLDQWLLLSGYHPNGRRNGAGNGNDPFGAGGTPPKLTAEQVYALPEIPAPRSNDIDIDIAIDIDIDIAIDIDIETGSTPDELAVTYHGDDDDNTNININTNSISDSNATSPDMKTEAASGTTTDTTLSETAEAAGTDETPNESLSPLETPSTPTHQSSAPAPLFTTTMSTSCSICIDDFEEGETIRLLPRCGHAFHTDCILPWLTERQGCCPCCKTLVICPPARDNNTEEAKENDNENNESAIHGNSDTNSNNEEGWANPTGMGRSSYLSSSSSVVLGNRNNTFRPPQSNFRASPFAGPW